MPIASLCFLELCCPQRQGLSDGVALDSLAFVLCRAGCVGAARASGGRRRFCGEPGRPASGLCHPLPPARRCASGRRATRRAGTWLGARRTAASCVCGWGDGPGAGCAATCGLQGSRMQLRRLAPGGPQHRRQPELRGLASLHGPRCAVLRRAVQAARERNVPRRRQGQVRGHLAVRLYF